MAVDTFALARAYGIAEKTAKNEATAENLQAACIALANLIAVPSLSQNAIREALLTLGGNCDNSAKKTTG